MVGSVRVEYQKNLTCDNEILWVLSRCTTHSLHATGEILSNIDLTLSPVCSASKDIC